MHTIHRIIHGGCGGALLAFALIAPGTAQSQEQTVHLLVKPRPGQMTRTRNVFSMHLPMQGDITVTEIETETVKQIRGNGDVVTEINTSGRSGQLGTIHITYADTEDGQPVPGPYTLIHDRTGRVKETLNMSTAPDSPLPDLSRFALYATNFILTDKPVRPNDTWETVVDNPLQKEQTITVHGAYLGREALDGKDYWKVKQTAHILVDLQGNAMEIEGAAWIDPANETVFKRESVVNGMPIHQNDNFIRYEIFLSLSYDNFSLMIIMLAPSM